MEVIEVGAGLGGPARFLAASAPGSRGASASPWRAHLGLLLAGWGIFNVVEGLIDHQILGIPHVRDDFGGPIGSDLGFLSSASP